MRLNMQQFESYFLREKYSNEMVFIETLEQFKLII